MRLDEPLTSEHNKTTLLYRFHKVPLTPNGLSAPGGNPVEHLEQHTEHTAYSNFISWQLYVTEKEMHFNVGGTYMRLGRGRNCLLLTTPELLERNSDCQVEHQMQKSAALCAEEGKIKLAFASLWRDEFPFSLTDIPNGLEVLCVGSIPTKAMVSLPVDSWFELRRMGGVVGVAVGNSRYEMEIPRDMPSLGHSIEDVEKRLEEQAGKGHHFSVPK